MRKISSNLIRRAGNEQKNRLKSKSPKAHVGKPDAATIRERGTIDDAVAILGVCSRTARQLALRGELPQAAKIGRRWTFDLERLREYVKRKETESCSDAKHLRERFGAVWSSGGEFRPVAGTLNGRYAQTIQRLRSAGSKKREIAR
jgi:hypothetical protein